MAMNPFRPSFMQDPNKYKNVDDTQVIPPKGTHADSPLTLPFQGQLGLHERIDFTLSVLQQEAAQRQEQMSDMVTKMQHFLQPPELTHKYVLLPGNTAGLYPMRVQYPFFNERWMLKKLTLTRRGIGTFPSSVFITVEADEPEPIVLDATVPFIELNMPLFGGNALIFTNNDAANSGMLYVEWRRLWSIESGHGM